LAEPKKLKLSCLASTMRAFKFSAQLMPLTYLLACQRYVEPNPVRAAMVDDPAHYRWTSYRANGLGQFGAILTPHPFGRTSDPDSFWRKERSFYANVF
jgi:hypothetical protein